MPYREVLSLGVLESLIVLHGPFESFFYFSLDPAKGIFCDTLSGFQIIAHRAASLSAAIFSLANVLPHRSSYVSPWEFLLSLTRYSSSLAKELEVFCVSQKFILSFRVPHLSPGHLIMKFLSQLPSTVLVFGFSGGNVHLQTTS